MDDSDFSLFEDGNTKKTAEEAAPAQTPLLRDIVSDSADVPRQRSRLAFAGMLTGLVSFILSLSVYSMLRLSFLPGLVLGVLCLLAGITAQGLGIASLVKTRGREKLQPILAIIAGLFAVIVLLFVMLLVVIAVSNASAA